MKSAKSIAIILSILLPLSPSLVWAQHVSDSPVNLSDSQSFDMPLTSMLSHAEITSARRRVANAVSVEKFIDGVKTAFFIALAAYSASASRAGSTTNTRFIFAPSAPATP